MSRMITAAGLLICAAAGGCVGEGDSGARVVTEVVAEGLNNPTSIVVGSGGAVWVAESGAGRIVAIDADGAVTPLISGFDVGTFAPYSIAPLSIIAAAAGGWIVGEGGNPPGQERVSFHAADGSTSAEPLIPLGGGDYSGLALRPTTGDLIIASASTDRIFGAAPLAESGFGEPEVIIDDTTAPPIHSTAPTALAFDSAEWLYVGFAGEDSSGIVRIDPETSFAEAVVTTDSPVTGIAFRPSDESLFFTVLGEVGSESGAVVTIGTNGLASEFARRLPSPTALAFDSDDGLYVTVLGTSPNGTAGQVQYLHVEEAAEEEDPATSDADDGS